MSSGENAIPYALGGDEGEGEGEGVAAPVPVPAAVVAAPNVAFLCSVQGCKCEFFGPCPCGKCDEAYCESHLYQKMCCCESRKNAESRNRVRLPSQMTGEVRAVSEGVSQAKADKRARTGR